MIPSTLTDESRPGFSSRPRQRPGFVAFPVANELVLLSPEGEVAHALNQSAAGVWELCDGEHTPLDMIAKLREFYGGDDIRMLADISDVLFRFHHLGLVELERPTIGSAASMAVRLDPRDTLGPRVRFVFGIEDKPYFHWQLAILFESMVGQLAPGWDITVIVCNDHGPVSDELERVLRTYGIRGITGQNHAHSHKIDFSAHDDGYVALNRVEALRVIAPYLDAEDVVCLMDTDLFLYGDLQVDLFPAHNAMAASQIIADKLFMGYGSEHEGIDLQKLLNALGCERELKRGGVTVFMTGATLGHDEVIRDCFRFAQIMYLMGKASGLGDKNVWLAEMACFAMALTANRIDYELLDTRQFAVPFPEETMPTGSFFHYYADVNDGRGGPFPGSEWNKQLFYDRDFLAEDLESFRRGAQSDIEKRFLDLSIAARRRLLGSQAS